MIIWIHLFVLYCGGFSLLLFTWRK